MKHLIIVLALLAMGNANACFKLSTTSGTEFDNGIFYDDYHDFGEVVIASKPGDFKLYIDATGCVSDPDATETSVTVSISGNKGEFCLDEAKDPFIGPGKCPQPNTQTYDLTIDEDTRIFRGDFITYYTPYTNGKKKKKLNIDAIDADGNDVSRTIILIASASRCC